MNFIKKLFSKTKIYNDTFRVRVVPHGSGEFYRVEYKLAGYNTSWKRYNIGFFLFGNPSLWDMNHPYLETDFDTAIEFAKTLTKEKVGQQNKKLIDRYNKKLLEYNERMNKRNKVWES